MKKRYLKGMLSVALAFLMLSSACIMPVSASMITDPPGFDDFDGCGIHSYDQKNVASRYTASVATCSKKATYYYSCYCGEKGTETFEYGATLPHTYSYTVMSEEYRVKNSTSDGYEYYYSCVCGAKGTKTFTVKSEDVIYTNPFEGYEGVESDMVENMLNADFLGYPSTLTPITQNDNTSMKIDVDLVIPEDSEYNVPLYAYAKSSYTKFTALKIVSYDASARTVTLSDDQTYIVSGTPDPALGYYGTFSYDGVTWILSTGKYAAAVKFGDGYNVDRPTKIILPEISYSDYGTIYLEASYFIEPNSKGVFESQFINYKANGEDKSYLHLYTINLETGALNRGGKLSIGKWNTVGVLFNLAAGKADFFLNGMAVNQDVNFGVTNLDISSWSIAKIMKGTPLAMEGAFYVDNVAVYEGTIADTLFDFKPYSNDFESYADGETLATDMYFADVPSADKVGMTDGNKYWKVNATVNNMSNKLNNFAVNASEIQSVVYEAKYYIPSDAKFQMQTQFFGMSGVKDGAAATFPWNDVYVLYANGSITEIRREGDSVGSGYALPTDTFFTVSVALDLTTGTYNVYVDQKLALENEKFSAFDTITEIAAGSIIIGKINSVSESWATGYAYIDDIKFYEGSDKDVNGSIPASVTFRHSMQAFLYLESEVKMGVGYKIEGMENINPADLLDRFGLLIWDASDVSSEEDAIYENCEYVVSGAVYNAADGRFETTANGIVAKELGDMLSFRAYYRNDDGSYSYSRLISNYSPKRYCYNQINNNPNNAELVHLMASILNYGAAAQIHFAYNTDNLMNSDLPAELQAMTWDGSLVRSDYSVPNGKDSAFVRAAQVTSRGGFLNLEGAIDYNFYAKVSFEPASAKIYYWTESDLATLDSMTLANASSSEDLVWSDVYNRWEGKYEGQPAKEMFETVFACMVFEDTVGNEYYSGVIGYSPERYAYINQNKGDTNAELAKRLVVYGDAARAFFD